MDSDVEIFAQNLNLSQRPAARREGPTPRKTPRPRGGARPRETEEEATIRRQHDAQRMARFRARRKKALEERLATNADAGQSSQPRDASEADTERRGGEAGDPETEGKYAELLAIIERLGRDVRLTYAGGRSSAERLKSGIARARSLVRDCLVKTRINLRH